MVNILTPSFTNIVLRKKEFSILYTQSHNTNLLKSIVFVLIIFPFISHIYGAVFPALYNFEIFNIVFAIIAFVMIIAVYENRIVWDKDIVYFLPFFLTALASSVYNNDLYFLKYFAYIFIYFFFLKRFFLQKFIFKLYVNILVFTFFILIVIYFLTLNFDFHKFFVVRDLNFLSLNSPMHLKDHQSQVFYLLIYQNDYSGIFNIPRFYGFSREPGMYVMFIIPGFLMACFFKMKFQAFTLAFAILITSSFTGYVVLFLLLYISVLPIKSYSSMIYLILIPISLLVIFRNDTISLLDSERANVYLSMFENSFINLSFIGALFILSFIVILYNYFIKLKTINLKIVVLFFISIVILLNKASELLSPLFLFYLSFIDFIYKVRKHLETNRDNIRI